MRTLNPWVGSDGENVQEFPVQSNLHDRVIPWTVAEEAYKEYAAQHGKAQSLERLAERHGFGCSELAILLYQRIKRLENAGR